jgi:cell division protein FtsB
MYRQQRRKLELINASQEVVVYHQPLPSHDLVQKNRLLLKLIVALMLVIFLLSSFLLPAHNMGEQLIEKQIADAESLKNPVLSAEIDSLKGQLVGLVSGSIESKLASIEKNIKRGRVLGALETVHSLKKDVKALRTYSEPLEKKNQEEFRMNQRLAEEVVHLKNLIYVTLGSCGLMFAAFAGVWVKNRRKLITTHTAEYIAKSSEDLI